MFVLTEYVFVSTILLGSKEPVDNSIYWIWTLSEAGGNPALCLSNRDIDERAGGQRKSLEPKLWEGAQVGYKD